jgi:hypothetical protein
MAIPTEALAAAAQPAQMVTGREVEAKPPVLLVVAAAAVMAAGYRQQGSQAMGHQISAEAAGLLPMARRAGRAAQLAVPP